MKVLQVLAAILGVLLSAHPPAASGREESQFRDVFSLMEEVDRLSKMDLWPGFSPGRIPAAIFDGKVTYLFGLAGAPEGFGPIAGRDGVFVFPGRHEAVLGNRRARLGGTWIATAIPGYGPVANHRANTLADIAAVVLHEKFHVFQAERHPRWTPNDLTLMNYPMDGAEALSRRRLELEAFRRAVLSADPEGAAAWAENGLGLRRQRLAALTSAEARYEREIQKLEGLAQYIENRASGRTGAEEPIEDDVAPRGVRHLGYFEGAWMAHLLDRFDPDWKEGLEARATDALEDLLAAALPEGAPAAFTPREISKAESAAAESVSDKAEERRRVDRGFLAKLGYRIDVRSVKARLVFEAFDPFSFEALPGNRILHPLWVTCKAAAGSIRILGKASLTEIDDRGRILRLILPGVRNKPDLKPGMNVPLRLNDEGVKIDLERGMVRFQGNSIVIDLLD